MKALARNKQTLYYSLYNGITDVLDSDGNLTGEKATSYSLPVMCRMNVSPNTGNAYTSFFGTNGDYSHVLCSDDVSLPISPTTRLWIGKTPDLTSQTYDDYNFVVLRVAKSLNSVLIAVKEVDTGA